jgi:hypothetical protein
MPRRSVIVAVALLTVVGCSSSGDRSGAGNSGLATALAKIPATGTTIRYVAYTDMARLRADGIVNRSAGSSQSVAFGWDQIASLGTGDLYRQSSSLPAVLGLDLHDVDSAVATGASIRPAAYDFTGHFDASAITGKLTRLGGKPHVFGSAHGLSAAPHVISDKLARRQFYAGETLDQVIVTSGEFASSTTAADLPDGPDAATSLADEARYVTIADCLGDVIGALIRTAAAHSNSVLVAAGIRDPGKPDGQPREVLCSVPAAGKQAAVRAGFARAFAAGATDPLTGHPVSATVSSAHVSVTSGAVRAELVTQGPLVGYLINALYGRAARYWDGTCPAAQVAQGRC